MGIRESFEQRRRGFRRALCSIVFGTIFVLGLTPTVPAEQRNECTKGFLKPSYGYVFSGLRVGVGPVAAAGIIAFDGQGGVTAQDTVNNSVAISRRTGIGGYTVNSNCTGSAELGGDYGGLSFDFIIVPGSGGSVFSFLVTNPGTIQPGVAVATGDKECALATFKGIYLNLRADTRFPVGGPIAGLEVADADGMGNISFPQVTQSRNGVFTHPTATGTYRVNPNCTATLNLIVDGVAPSHREGVVVAGGNEAFFVGTLSPGIIGTAQFKKQPQR